MTENTDKVTITLKADGQAPWIVVHAANAEEAHQILGAVYTGGAQSLAEHAAAASAALTNAWVEEKKRQQPGQPAATAARVLDGQVQQTQVAPAQEAGFGGTPSVSCIHGERVHRTGSTAKGPWEALFCPTAKGTTGQCAPLFKDQKTGVFK